MGGFLQSIIYGFGGLRIRPEILEFHNPTPTPQSNWLRIKGFQYLGRSNTEHFLTLCKWPHTYG